MAVFSEILALEWMDTRGVLIFIFVFLILADYLRNISPSDFPPGPWTLPIIRDTYRVDPNKMHLNFEKVCLLWTTIISNSKRLAFKKSSTNTPSLLFVSIDLIDKMLSLYSLTLFNYIIITFYFSWLWNMDQFLVFKSWVEELWLSTDTSLWEKSWSREEKTMQIAQVYQYCMMWLEQKVLCVALL